MREDTYPVPILTSKLHRPSVAPDVVPLEGQLGRLEAGRERPLTVVSAPAGYGKSTLISSWLERTAGPSVWLSLDEGDSDLRTFLSHLVAALRGEFPQFGQELLVVMGGPDLPSPAHLGRRLAGELDALEARVVVTLDDYHRLKGAAVPGLIDSLLEHPPRSLHLAVVSRRDPPFATRSMTINGQLTEVRMRDLRLGRGEAATFLAQASGQSVSEEAASRIHRATEGWPAGLRLAALALHRRPDVEELIHGMDSGAVHAQRYMISEVLARQPREMQDFLCRTSILDSLCAPLCEVVGAVEGGDAPLTGSRFIAVLQTEGLFIVPLDDHGEWFRYHHLFQDLLRIELEARATPDEIAALHRGAAHWLDRNGTLEEALPHYLSGSEPGEVEEVVVRHCREVEKREQWHRLAKYLEGVPTSIAEQNIELQIIAAFCADKRARYGEMVQGLDRAEALLAESPAGDSPTDNSLGRVEMMRSGLLAHMGEGREALERGQRALELLPDEASKDRAYALIMVACGLQMTGELARARLVLGEESELRARSGATYQGQLLQARYLVEWMSADLPRLVQCATAGLELSQKHDLVETSLWSRFHLGASQYQQGDLQQAAATLDPVVASRYGPSFHMHIMAIEVTALIEQALGRPDRARELVDSLAEYLLEIGNESYREYVEGIQAGLGLRQGRRAKAVRWAMDYQAEERWAGYHFSAAELTAARVLITADEADCVERAGRMLEELQSFYSSSCGTLFLIQTLAIQALYFDATGNREEAVSRLGEAIDLARPSGMIRLFADLGGDLAPLMHRLDLDEEGLQYVGRILAALRAEAEQQPVVANGEGVQPADLVEDLTPRELEILSLLALHLSNKEIGTRLFISLETVKHHVKNLFGKLSVHSRRDAVAKGQGLGLLGDDGAADRASR